MNNKYYPMNSAEVLDQVLAVYKKSFFKQIAVSIIFSIIFFAIAYFLLLIGMYILLVGLVIGEFAPGTGIGTIINIIAFLILLILGISMFQALTATGNALISKHTFFGEYCDVGGILKASFKKILIATSAILANLIILLPVIAMAAFLVYIFYIVAIMDFYVAAHAPTIPIIAAFMFLIILILALLLICAVITMMSISVAVFESRWFFGAVMRSFKLIKPDFIRIMGLFVIWLLITVVLMHSFDIIFYIVSVLLMYFSPEEAGGVVFLIFFAFSSLFSLIIGTIVAPLPGIFSTIIYINQRFKLEGVDIEFNLSALEVKRKHDDIRASHERGAE